MLDGQRSSAVTEREQPGERCLPQGRFPFDRLVRFYDFDQIMQAAADDESGAVVKPIIRIG